VQWPVDDPRGYDAHARAGRCRFPRNAVGSRLLLVDASKPSSVGLRVMAAMTTFFVMSDLRTRRAWRGRLPAAPVPVAHREQTRRRVRRPAHHRRGPDHRGGTGRSDHRQRRSRCRLAGQGHAVRPALALACGRQAGRMCSRRSSTGGRSRGSSRPVRGVQLRPAIGRSRAHSRIISGDTGSAARGRSGSARHRGPRRPRGRGGR
jgi:hypothetical protein